MVEVHACQIPKEADGFAGVAAPRLTDWCVPCVCDRPIVSETMCRHQRSGRGCWSVCSTDSCRGRAVLLTPDSCTLFNT